MQFSLLFVLTVYLNWFAYEFLGKKFALDKPNVRKIHRVAVPQIGGIVFGSSFLLLCLYLNLTPSWFIYGGFISLFLGMVDDLYNINWKIKISFQLLILIYICVLFWGKIELVQFYQFNIALNQPILALIFSVWFLGIYNAVNLVDGLDGLAGGFIVIYLVFSLFYFSFLSSFFILLIINLLAFLVFNQRPAKIFMGDSGSLFLGFIIAVLPLLIFDLSPSNIKHVDMTPFSILSTYLIADTIRVFSTRLFSKKNPMTADTIHLHHLVIQQSGSYLLTVFLIYILTSITCLFVIIKLENGLGGYGAFIHFSLIFLFLLTPPAPTYVKLLSKAIRPIYSWQKNHKQYKVNRKYYMGMVIALLIILFISLIIFNNYEIFSYEQLLISVLLILYFFYKNNFNKIALVVFQIFLSILILESYWKSETNEISQLISIFLIISFLVSTLQRTRGTKISQYSSLDLLFLALTLCGLILFFMDIRIINYQLLMTLFSLWYGIGFVYMHYLQKNKLNKFENN